MLRLSIRPPSGKPYTVPVTDLPLTIGRSQRSDLRIADPFASRVHAELSADGAGSLRVSDLESGNGTFVNGHRVNGHGALRPGDQLKIGNTLLGLEEGLARGAVPEEGERPGPPPGAEPSS